LLFIYAGFEEFISDLIAGNIQNVQ